jgi:hypothetical protein
MSWPFCPECKDDLIDYHRASIGRLKGEIERHEAAIEKMTGEQVTP